VYKEHLGLLVQGALISRDFKQNWTDTTNFIQTRQEQFLWKCFRSFFCSKTRTDRHTWWSYEYIFV